MPCRYWSAVQQLESALERRGFMVYGASTRVFTAVATTLHSNITVAHAYVCRVCVRVFADGHIGHCPQKVSERVCVSVSMRASRCWHAVVSMGRRLVWLADVGVVDST